MEESHPAIAVRHISKAYHVYHRPIDRLRELISLKRRSYHQEYWALKDISFEVEEGTIIGIIGQNGAGKSTLLQVLAGILQPTAGEVRIRGRIAALLALGAGFDPEFTGRENVFLNGSILGIDRAEMEKRFDLITDFAEIGTFIDQPVKTYSSGMYVRLAFAVAANVDADVLLLDEALSVGDSMFQKRCFARLEQARRDGKTIILASHGMQVIQTVCNKVILVDHGEILKMGEPVAVCLTYHELLARREEEYVARLQGSQGKRAYWIDDQAGDLEELGFDRSEAVREYRFGSREAEILEVEMYNDAEQPCRAFQLGEQFSVRVTIQFHRDIEEPNVGMVIHTSLGVKVYGNNTDEVGHPLGRQEAGTVVTVEFSQTMQLNARSYILSCGVTEKCSTHVRILDKRKDIMLFKVLSAKRFHGLVDLDTQVRMRTHASV